MLLSANIDISKVVGLLKTEYHRRAEFSPLLWSKGMKLQLKEVYTRLKVVSRRKAGSSEIDMAEIDMAEVDMAEIDVDDIFKPSEENNGQLVLVEGSPGIGKTTFCLKLALDWANGAMPRNFPTFKLVFLLKCRDIIKDVVEEIFEPLLPEDLEERIKETLANFLEDLDNQKQILIILDGLDELPEKSEDRVNKVLGRKKLSFCYALATTRQEKGIETRKLLRFDMSLAIEGFSKDVSFEYIRKHFRNIGTGHSSKGERLIEEVKQNPLLGDLQTNPLNLLLLCVVYEDHEGSLPSSITDLYQTIVRCLLRRYCAREELKASEKDEDLDKQFEISILALGELAWKCLLKDRLSFYQDELEELERSNENIVARRLGLVYKEESSKWLKPRHVYSFLHKTFQEYLAASYVAHKFRRSEFQMLEQMLFPKTARKKFKQVFVFVCGILREEANILFELTGNMLQKQWDWLICDYVTAKFFVESWKETGNAERMAKTLFSFLPFSRSLHVWVIDHGRALCAVLNECAKFSEELTFAEVHMSWKGYFSKRVPQLLQLPDLKSFILYELTNCKEVGFEDLNETLREKLTFALFAHDGGAVSKVPDFGLSSVRLKICGSLGSSLLQDFENLLVHKCLCSLSITVCGDVQESLFEALARGLEGQSAVKFLYLYINGNFSVRGAYLLEQGIFRNKSLTNIKVSVNGEPPENWLAVAKNLRAQSAEKAIVSEIHPNTFSKVKDSQVTHLNRFLSKTDLKQQTATLNVWGELSGDGCKAVCEVLLHTPVSHLTLNIHGQFTDEMLRHIARYVEEQEKLSPITINAWVEITEKENKLIKELGLDKNPSVSLNVRGTRAPLKESSDSNVVSCDKPQSSRKSLTIKMNDDESNEWEHGLSEGLPGNTSLKSLTLEIGDYDYQYIDADDEWRRALDEELAGNTSLKSPALEIGDSDDEYSGDDDELGRGLGEELAGNTSLKSLALEIGDSDDDYSDDDDELGRGLGEQLAGNTSLKSPALEIGGSDDEYSDDDDEWGRGLGEQLAENTSLKSPALEIGDSDDEYSDDDNEWARRLGLARNTSLESLTVQIVKVSFMNGKWKQDLGKVLAGNTSLKSLTLEINDYDDYCYDDDDEWGRGLGEGLATNSSLESLTIKTVTASFLNGKWGHGLGEGLAGNTSLKSLTLEIEDNENKFDEWVHGLGEGLASSKSLESLTLAINNSKSRSNKWRHVLFESLGKNKYLNSLTLTINNYYYLSDEWGVGLAEDLAGNTSLKSITLAINNYFYMSSVWGLGLFEGSARNTSLKSITLSINNYGTMKGEQRHDSIEGLARNSSLTSITLAFNNYGDMKGEWGHCLFEGLARSTSLNSLTLTANNYGEMSEEWGCVVRERLRKSKSLTECNLIVDICGKC